MFGSMENNFASHEFPSLTSDDARIVRGNDASLGQFPYQVTLASKSGNLLCGGSLVTSILVMTAAHCVHGKSPENIRVISGNHKLNTVDDHEQVVNVNRIEVHEGYRFQDYRNDIAVIFLSTEITLNMYANTIAIPTEDTKFENSAIVSGWGHEFHGACKGLDGKTYLCGIVSWGKECGTLPGVYTNVAKFSEWIKSKIDPAAMKDIYGGREAPTPSAIIPHSIGSPNPLESLPFRRLKYLCNCCTAVIFFLRNRACKGSSGSSPLGNFINSVHVPDLHQCMKLELGIIGDVQIIGTLLLPYVTGTSSPVIKILPNGSHPLIIPFSKHNFGCSVFIGSVGNGTSLPISILGTSKDYLLTAPFIFILSGDHPSQVESTSLKIQLQSLAILTRPLKNTFFLVTSSSRTQERPQGSKVNLQKERIVGVVCARCDPKDSPSKVPIPLAFTFYQLSLYINATPAFKPTLGDMYATHSLRVIPGKLPLLPCFKLPSPLAQLCGLSQSHLL
ncbi:unnamed protein product [Allacma fusca]|uniref:Peptidase S1 domain-containing protein n=1 Tax=Allacma fusca TaxID=39272 RepID=A0A8J2P002_9HEXA|nr:unnamed protein product [Allacma fusca]